MAQAHRAATMGYTSSGTPTNTRPLPVRTAASPAYTGAPV